MSDLLAFLILLALVVGIAALPFAGIYLVLVGLGMNASLAGGATILGGIAAGLRQEDDRGGVRRSQRHHVPAGSQQGPGEGEARCLRQADRRSAQPGSPAVIVLTGRSRIARLSACALSTRTLAKKRSTPHAV
jgi:hypothetical protein